ncbi:hypothetical protein THAOC_35922, partial [Thalassiosira oceanica]
MMVFSPLTTKKSTDVPVPFYQQRDDAGRDQRRQIRRRSEATLQEEERRTRRREGEKKRKKTTNYRTRIVEAIVKLKARSPGSNSLTIKECVRAYMPADEEWTNSVFLNALKMMVTDGDLVQTGDRYMFSQEFWEENIQKKSAGARMDAEYIYNVMIDVEEYRMCDYGLCDGNQRAITAVIRRDGKAAVAPFFEPLDVSYFQTLTFFNGGGGSLQSRLEKGITSSGSAVEQMEAFNKYFEEQDDYHWGGQGERYDTIPELEWLIKKLKNAL